MGWKCPWTRIRLALRPAQRCFGGGRNVLALRNCRTGTSWKQSTQKQRHLRQCRDNSSEQDAMTPVRRACAALLHFVQSFRYLSICFMPPRHFTDPEDSRPHVQSPLVGCVSTLANYANEVQQVTTEAEAMATLVSKRQIQHPCGRGDSAICDA